jgi:hypothetical protein
MFLCPNCKNIFDITNTLTVQSGGAKNINYEEIITKILMKEVLEEEIIKILKIDDITKQESYNNLKLSNREYVYNKVMELTKMHEENLKNIDIKKPLSDMYFICKNCGTTKKIKENTLIFSKVSSDISQSYVAPDLSSMKYSDIIPITKKYVCPNRKCVSHDNLEKREAKFFRLNNSYRLKYICLACDEIFDPL